MFVEHQAVLDAVRGGFAGRRVVVVGDLMLDRYLWGQVERISPEAPVPVVRIERESARIGGAGNVARNLVSLGGKAVMVGVVGNDERARGDHVLTLDDGEPVGDLAVDPDDVSAERDLIAADGEHSLHGPGSGHFGMVDQHDIAPGRLVVGASDEEPVLGFEIRQHALPDDGRRVERDQQADESCEQEQERWQKECGEAVLRSSERAEREAAHVRHPG
jgi:hypothetical protein